MEPAQEHTLETLQRIMTGLAVSGNVLAAAMALLALACWWGSLLGEAGAYLAVWLLVPLAFFVIVAALCGWTAWVMGRYCATRGWHSRQALLTPRALVWLSLPGSLLLLAWLLHLGPLLKALGSMIWTLVSVTFLHLG